MPRTCAPRPTRGTRATLAVQSPDRACPPVAGGVQGQARYRTYKMQLWSASDVDVVEISKQFLS
eukprot:7700399-Pyramimonas_sp.AAC.1